MGRQYFLGEQKGKPPVADYNEVNLLETDDAKVAKLEYWIAKKVGEAVAQEYPNRQWEIRVDISGGILVVVCPSVSLTKGYHLYLNRTMFQLIADAKRAAGEILERHNVSRRKDFDPTTLQELPRTLREDVIAVDAAPDPISKVDHAA